MSPMEVILSSYYPFLVMGFFASVIGAIIVAAMDAPKVEAGRLAHEH